MSKEIVTRYRASYLARVKPREDLLTPVLDAVSSSLYTSASLFQKTLLSLWTEQAMRGEKNKRDRLVANRKRARPGKLVHRKKEVGLSSIIKFANGALEEALSVLEKPQQGLEDLDTLLGTFNSKRTTENSESITPEIATSTPTAEREKYEEELAKTRQEIDAQRAAIDSYAARVTKHLMQRSQVALTPVPAKFAHLVPETAQVDEDQVNDLIARFDTFATKWAAKESSGQAERAEKTTSRQVFNAPAQQDTICAAQSSHKHSEICFCKA